VERETGRIESLISHGGRRDWFSYLRDCRERLERAAGGGGQPALLSRLADVLLEQYLLAPFMGELAEAEQGERQRLQDLSRRLRRRSNP
jgi:hypothetical protein